MACEFCDVCKKMAAIKATRDKSGVLEYPLTELKKEMCDAADSAQRQQDCIAYPEFQANNRANQWSI